MKFILKDLYYGKIAPWERGHSKDPEHNELNRKIEEEKRYFIQKMSLDDCTRFQALESLYSQSGGMEEAEAFADGFKLGFLLAAAVYGDDDEST